MQHTARFVAVHDAELRESQRQIAMRERPLLDDLRVPRTVHGLHCRALSFVREREHVLAKVVPVTALLPNRAADELGGFHLFEAGSESPRSYRAFERAIHGVASRVPKHHSGRLFLEMKEIELLA